MVEIQQVRRDAPWSWLKAGWSDIVRAPRVTLGYGLVFVMLGALIVLGLEATGLAAAIPVALSGFALVAPALAIGIYQVPRALERGEAPRFRLVISRFPSRLSQIGFLSLLLVMLFLLWVRIAQFLLVGLAPGAPLAPGPFLEFALSDPGGADPGHRRHAGRRSAGPPSPSRCRPWPSPCWSTRTSTR